MLPRERAPAQTEECGKVCQVECWAQGDSAGRETGQRVNEQMWAPKSGAAQGHGPVGRCHTPITAALGEQSADPTEEESPRYTFTVKVDIPQTFEITQYSPLEM